MNGEEEGEEDEGVKKNKKKSDGSSFTNEAAITRFNEVINGMTKDERNNEIVKKIIDEFKVCEKEKGLASVADWNWPDGLPKELSLAAGRD